MIIGNARSIDRRFDPSQAKPRSQNSPKIEEWQQSTAQEDFKSRQQYKTIDSSWQANELAFHFYTSANHAHYYQLYMRAYGMETERLAWTVQRHLDGAEQNKNVTIFCMYTVQQITHQVEKLHTK